MNTLEAIAARRSVRAYDDRPVSHIDMQTLLDALDAVQAAAKEAMLASGSPFLEGRAGTPGFEALYNAPAAIAVAVPREEDPTAAAMGAASAGCAAQNIMVAATDLGLGSCYTACGALAFAVPSVASAVGIPEGMQVVCVIAVGVAADAAEPHARGTADAIWCE